MTDTSTKDAYTEAIEAQDLRTKATMYASSAITYGHVDRDWANAWLTKLGAETVKGKSEYRLNVAITGKFGRRVTASSRADAIKEFNRQLDRVLAAGKININSDRYDNVYDIQVVGDATNPVFHSGPEDAPTGENTLTLDELKAGVRQMLKEGVAEQGWGKSYAEAALDNLGLAPLPELVTKSVETPVAGTVTVHVTVYEEDGDEAVKAACKRALSNSGGAYLTPTEVGDPIVSATAAKDDDSSF